ncbi:AMP-binding protein [Bacteroidota bacterium]
MKNYSKLTFPELMSESFKSYPDHVALSFVDEKPLTYSDLKNNINSLIFFLEELGIKKDDKVAILSTNSPNWGVCYLAITFMGAVVVPLLPDFSSEEIKNILEHSESKLLFVSDNLTENIEGLKLAHLHTTVSIEDFNVINSKKDIPVFDINAEPQQKYEVEEEDLAAIIYTSGTTGKSKGVMLTHKNICSNAVGACKIQEILDTDKFLSILPLSHTLENTVGFVIPMISGSAVYYLRKLPTPAVLLPALQKIKPDIMLSVPLIIEKIYRNKVLPTFQKSRAIKFIYSIAIFRKLLNKVAGKKLMKTFGGNIRFFGIGGAKLDPTVEKFLLEAKFPYAIGYGLTESSPMIAGVNPQQTMLGTTGPPMEGVSIKLHNPDKITGEGEIWAKGPNIMKGYYKDPVQTREVLTEDGWLKTGDLATLDSNNFVYIKGRCKNVIIGSSGENIYPEDIESIINNFKHVAESIVLHQKGKLVAMVHFNKEEIEDKYRHMKEELTHYVEKKISELEGELQAYVNSRVSKFSQLQLVVASPDPFQKTATKKIKRFLYT